MNMQKKQIKTIFFGNNHLVLDHLIKIADVVSIFCRPQDTDDDNIFKIKELAKEHSISAYQPNKKDLYNYVSYIENLDVDLIVVCGYKYIIPEEIFEIPKYKAINIHPSYLPAYRGQHVINWAIINGEKETGVTIHYIDKDIDTGNVIVQKKVPILFDDTSLTLSDNIYSEACKLLQSVIDRIVSGETLQAKKQNNAESTYFKPRTPEDSRIDWNIDGVEIYNLIRALVKPWPGAYSYIKDKKIIIRDAKYENILLNCEHGKIINICDSTLIISVKGGQLVVNDYTIIDENDNMVHLSIEIGNELE
ncbi:MAG: methionyl-tRNA formyltransferase [Methanococcoides sp.]|nr:methionyl-tRNA formyltransferase [Methanococcoides sp.]